MAEIGAYEAKTHLPKLLKRVQKKGGAFCHHQARATGGRALVPVAGRDPRCQDQAGDRGASAR